MKYYYIFGLRNSGTTFFDSCIKNNFSLELNPAHSIRPAIIWKHFFLLENLKKIDFDNTVVFLIARNPFDWLNSMWRNPHHIKHMKKDKNTFLYSEFYSLDHSGKEILLDREPINGNRFKNIIQMRNKKHSFILEQNFKNFKYINYNFFVNNYEKQMIEIKELFDLVLKTPTIFKEDRYFYGCQMKNNKFSKNYDTYFSSQDLTGHKNFDKILETKLGFKEIE